jgi:hypothetical protein
VSRSVEHEHNTAWAASAKQVAACTPSARSRHLKVVIDARTC